MAEVTEKKDVRRAQASCAAGIANLEGRMRIALPKDIIAQSTLSALNTRLRNVEISVTKDSLPVPPCMEPSWESLAYRIWTMEGRAVQNKKVTVITKDPSVESTGRNAVITPVCWAMVPDPEAVTTETLKQMSAELVLRFSPRFPILSQQPALPWSGRADSGAKVGDDEKIHADLDEDSELLEIIRQTMFHVAGRHDHNISNTPLTRGDLYVTLAEVYVYLDIASKPKAPLPPPGWGRPGYRPNRKACCNCCSCNCHGSNRRRNSSDSDSDSDSDSNSSSSSSGSSIRARRWKRRLLPGFGWLRVLACWKRPKDDDTSSISTRSSRTAV